jgi:ABC-2 type transport system permease protein
VSTAAYATKVPKLNATLKVTLPRVALSEWTKLRSLRSTRWSLLAAAVLTIGFPLLFAAVTSSRWGHMSAPERALRDPLQIALAGVGVSQLAIAVLGVLTITAEYSTGTIRSSLTAVPRRLPVLWAKLGVFSVVAFVFSLPAVVTASFASHAILSRHHILQVSFSDAGVARSVVGAAVYLMLVGAFALALGAVVRNTAGGISAFAAIFFVIPPLLLLLPASWDDAISPYLPSEAGRSIFLLTHGPHTLAPGPGLALFVGYVLLAIAVAAVMLVRRDA